LPDQPTTISPRGITPGEIEHYVREGWVKVDSLVSSEAAAELLERVERIMQPGSAGTNEADGSLEIDALEPIFSVSDFPSDHDPVLREFSHSSGLGQIARDLIDGRYREYGGSCEDVRLFEDQVLAKHPAQTGGERTPWHQDSNLQPFDRFGALVVWIALVDIPPERGSLRFLSGSHRVPPLGRVFHRSDGVDLLDEYPGLLDRFDVSPPLDLRAGDATVHDYSTIHSAPANTTREIRWAYLAEFFPANTLYTGMPSRQTRDLGLIVDQPLAHERFPIVPA
jgi:Phytanoyl-CoA dioxygenase (PhyH)